MIFENVYEYSVVQYQLIAGLFTLTAAVFAAALVYFLATRSTIAPRYRLSSVLSAVVMVSAFLELAVLSLSWRAAFRFDGTAYVSTDEPFSQAFRYMNWSIDVPVLLTQLLIVLMVTGQAFRRTWAKFVIAGLLMIYTGYVGQVNEVDSPGTFFLWGSISTVFMVYLLWLVGQTLFRARESMPRPVWGLVTAVFWLLLGSWTLYPIAYLIPQLFDGAWAIVGRSISFTVADITSKAVYGVLLGVIAQKLSALDGFPAAVVQQEAVSEEPVRPEKSQVGRPQA